MQSNKNAPLENTSNRTVFITGAAKGIGRAVALTFARNCWNVVGHYFDSHKLALDLKSEVQKLGRYCALVQGDLQSEHGITSIIEHMRSSKIDAMINNAGSYIVQKHFTQLSFDDLKAVFTLNAFAPVLLTAKVFGQMKANRFGRIVNISSIAAKYGGSANSLHYGCAKRALEGLSKTFAREGASYNVLVNTVRPGVINTDFHSTFAKNMEQRIGLIPLKRMGTPKEVAETVYFLGSDKNTYITNEILTIAGGE